MEAPLGQSITREIASVTAVMCAVIEFTIRGHVALNVSLVMEKKIILQYDKSLRRNRYCARGLVKVAKWEDPVDSVNE